VGEGEGEEGATGESQVIKKGKAGGVDVRREFK
jgi:hypothetical protein